LNIYKFFGINAMNASSPSSAAEQQCPLARTRASGSPREKKTKKQVDTFK